VGDSPGACQEAEIAGDRGQAKIGAWPPGSYFSHGIRSIPQVSAGKIGTGWPGPDFSLTPISRFPLPAMVLFNFILNRLVWQPAFDLAQRQFALNY
jgi:hypothetical protein